MKERTKFLFIGLLFLGFFAWQFLGGLFFSYPIVNYPPRGSSVMVVGDSLSVGVGASAPDRGYVGVLAKRLSVDIANAGISGETSKSALLHVDADLAKYDPDIVMVVLGGNDILGKIPPKETFDDIRQLIDKAQRSGAVVYLVGFQRFPHDEYAEGFEALARESGALYTPDLLGGIIGNGEYMSDEVHPNDRGYERVADKLAPLLESLVLSGRPEEPTSR
jgi:lysophospholipase L1-like esterase